MSTDKKVLFVLTSHSELGQTGKPTGWYLPEFAHPWNELHEHVQISVASPRGAVPPLDPSSVEASKEDAVSVNFLKDQTELFTKTEKLEKFLGRADEFDAIFFVGGHGPMFDLATDETSHKLINEFAEKGKIIAAVCHGPAAIAKVQYNGKPLIAGHAVTGFSNDEEEQVGLTSAMPFLLETELNDASGGKYEKAADAWAEKVVVSGKIITGQNPASAAGVGKAILKAIGA